jgi:hypothetical protein
MLVGHLAPFGPIAAVVERRWRPEWPRWTRALPWAAALAGSVFPDLDVIANILLTGNCHHLYFLPHSILPYLPLLALGWLLDRRRRTRLAGRVVLTFGIGVMVHLLLDTVSHGTLLFYPLSWEVVGWTFPRAGATMLASYLHSPNFWLEPGVLVAAAWWWVCTVRVWRRMRLKTRRRPLAYLVALPRHEGSRLLRLDRSR